MRAMVKRPLSRPCRTLRRWPHWTLALCVALTAVFFLLQTWTLPWAMNFGSDEGVYAMVGMRMMRGEWPHVSFGFWHMPGLPLLLGLSASFFHSLLPARLLLLLGGCAVPGLLAYAYRRILPLRGAFPLAVMAVVVFGNAFAQAADHDMRFASLRNAVNILFACWFFLATLPRQGKASIAAQAALVALSPFVLLPSLVVIAFAVPAAALAHEGAHRRAFLRRTLGMGLVAFGLVCAYFLAVPGSFHQVVVEQMLRPVTDGRIGRFSATVLSGSDGFLFCLSTLSILVSFVALPKARVASASFLAMIAFVLLLPSTYMPHYLVQAAPAFAYGVAAFAAVSFSIFRKRRLLAAGLVLSGVALQVELVLPQLLHAWLQPPSAILGTVRTLLRELPDPVFTMMPALALDAGRTITPSLHPFVARPPRSKTFKEKDLVPIMRQSCTVVIDAALRRKLSAKELGPLQSTMTVALDRKVLVLVSRDARCR